MSVSKTNLLEAVPVCSASVTSEWEGDSIVIAYPRFKNRWLQRYFFSKHLSREFHVRLEEHGTAVWQLIDGERTVQEIISSLTEHFGSEENYASRITSYILQLQKDGFIRLKVKTFQTLAD